MKKKIDLVYLTLEPAAFAAIAHIISHVRLGGRNKWEQAITDWYIDAGNYGIDDLVAEIAQTEGLPEITIEASDSEGVVINLK